MRCGEGTPPATAQHVGPVACNTRHLQGESARLGLRPRGWQKTTTRLSPHPFPPTYPHCWIARCTPGTSCEHYGCPCVGDNFGFPVSCLADKCESELGDAASTAAHGLWETDSPLREDAQPSDDLQLLAFLLFFPQVICEHRTDALDSVPITRGAPSSTSHYPLPPQCFLNQNRRKHDRRMAHHITVN